MGGMFVCLVQLESYSWCRYLEFPKCHRQKFDCETLPRDERHRVGLLT